MFLDKLNAYLCSLDLKDDILHRFLVTYAEFFPSYAILNQVIEQITSIIQKTSIDEETWFDDFNTCVAALRMIPESQEDTIAFYFDQQLFNENLTVDEYCKKLESVTKEQIVDVANKIRINTIYYLEK